MSLWSKIGKLGNKITKTVKKTTSKVVDAVAKAPTKFADNVLNSGVGEALKNVPVIGGFVGAGQQIASVADSIINGKSVADVAVEDVDAVSVSAPQQAMQSPVGSAHAVEQYAVVASKQNAVVASKQKSLNLGLVGVVAGLCGLVLMLSKRR